MPRETSPDPAGFPACRECYYVVHGTAGVCGSCVAQTIDLVGTDACVICSQRIPTGGRCTNRLCGNTDRSIDRIYAIAMKSGALEEKINALKQSQVRSSGYGWGIIFGRLVVAWLDDADVSPDLVVANPTYMVDGSSGHTELVLDSAQNEDVFGEWEIVPAALVKTRSTRHGRMTYAEKEAAADELLDAVEVHVDVDGLHVLVFDDISTTGLQLDRVARLLKAKGAARVDGLVLARSPWRT